MLFNSFSIPRWAATTLDYLEKAPFVDLTVFIAPSESRSVNRFHLVRDVATHVLYHLYEHIDYLLFRSRTTHDAYLATDVSEHVRRLTLLDDPTQGDQHERQKAVAQIEKANLDVMLSLSLEPTWTLDPRWARYGLWSLRLGTEASLDSPPFFWDLYRGHAVTESRLEISDGGPEAPRVAYRSHAATDPISLYRTRNRTYWKSATFPVRQLSDLAARGRSAIADLPPSPAPAMLVEAHVPTNFQMLRFLSAVVWRAFKRQVVKRFLRQEWFIAYREKRAELPETERMEDFSIVRAPARRSIMDPFLIERNRRHFIFIEDYQHDSEKAVISYCEVQRQGGVTEPEVALTREHHLSYPFVFTCGNDVYMIPETGSRQTVELYRAEEFPRQWVLDTVLLENITAFDASVVQHDRLFWLFASTPVEGAGLDDELSLFYASSLRGKWTPHPMNPVVSDVRSARPAGRLFELNGQLIRPSQDCSHRYGYAVVFNRVLELTTASYREEEIRRIEPQWSRRNLGTHSFSSDSLFEVIDGRRLRSKIRLPLVHTRDG